MSRFNVPQKAPKTATTNKAGGNAYQESPKLALVSLLLTSFVKDQFYRSAADGMRELKNLLVAIDDWKFAAKAAIFARTEFGMRSVTHIVAGEVAKHVKGPKAVGKGQKTEKSWTRSFFEKVVYRPDDITEILSYYQSTYGKPIPNSLKDGLGRALGKFDDYALAKYRGENKGLKMVDAVNLIHPKPTEKNADALMRLMTGELKSDATWETKMTRAGQEAAKADESTKEETLKKLKGEVWGSMLAKKELGYFALLRNLRNIVEQAPEHLDKALSQLIDSKSIKRSLVLPFRFTTAFEELKKLPGTQAVISAISQACDIACSNVPKLAGKTLVVLDHSGSMQGKPLEIGSLFAAVILKANPDSDFMVFATDASYVTMDPATPVLTLRHLIQQNCNGGGTNFNAIFERANRHYDRIIVLSDMQGWIGGGAPKATFTAYKNKYKADPKLYSFDLQGYGTLQFPERNVYAIAGFSEKIFDVMKMLEEDRDALIRRIEAVEL